MRSPPLQDAGTPLVTPKKRSHRESPVDPDPDTLASRSMACTREVLFSFTVNSRRNGRESRAGRVRSKVSSSGEVVYSDSSEISFPKTNFPPSDPDAITLTRACRRIRHNNSQQKNSDEMCAESRKIWGGRLTSRTARRYPHTGRHARSSPRGVPSCSPPPEGRAWCPGQRP